MVRNHIIISSDSKKATDKFQHSFMINFLETLGIDRTYLKIIKVICHTPTANTPLMETNREYFL